MSSEESHSSDKKITPETDWLEEFWKEFIAKFKTGDQKAKEFAKALGKAIEDIQSSLVSTTVCEYMGSTFFCSPCPRHKKSDDIMFIYPSENEKKPIFFCLEEPDAKFEDPYLIPNVRFADAQTLEIYGRLLHKLLVKRDRAEAEIITRYYRAKYGNRAVTVFNQKQLLEGIYFRLFGRKAPTEVILRAMRKLARLPVASGRPIITSGLKIEPDPNTAIKKWDVSVEDVYAKIVGFYREKFTSCYKIGYMLFCEPCPLHGIKGDMIILDPLAKIGSVREPLWTCALDPWSYYDRPNRDFPPLPENILDTFDELQESYSKKEIIESRVELAVRYFALNFTEDVISDKKRAKKMLRLIYRALFDENPTAGVIELMLKKVFSNGGEGQE